MSKYRRAKEEEEIMLEIAIFQSLNAETRFNYRDFAPEMCLDSDALMNKAKEASLLTFTAEVDAYADKQYCKIEKYLEPIPDSIEECEEYHRNRCDLRANFSDWSEQFRELETSREQLVDRSMLLLAEISMSYLPVEHYSSETEYEIMKAKKFKALTNSILKIVDPEGAEIQREYDEVQKMIRYTMDDVQMEASSANEKVAAYNDVFTAHIMARQTDCPKPLPTKQHIKKFNPF